MSLQKKSMFVFMVFSLILFIVTGCKLFISSVESPGISVNAIDEPQSTVQPKKSPYLLGKIAYTTISGDGFSQAFYIEDLRGNTSQFLASMDYADNASVHWSPDGQKLVFVIRQRMVSNSSYHLINTTANHVVIQPSSSTFGHFSGWTPDSRYAIFSYLNQYGDHTTDVYAVEDGQLVFPTMDDRQKYYPPFGKLYFGLIAVSPVSSTIILENGLLIDLSTNSKKALTDANVESAAWSSNGEYLGIVTVNTHPERQCGFYLFHKNQYELSRYRSQSCEDLHVVWNTSRNAMIFSNATSQYALNVTHLSLEISSHRNNVLDDSSPVLCQDSEIVLTEESALGQVHTKHWSPDCTLFAVGRSAGLEIYAADQTLLNTFHTTATVTYLAWSLLYDK